MIIPHDEVVELLAEIGLTALQAQAAAINPRIRWTDDAIDACLRDVDHSTMRKPAAALWSSFLSKGILPALPTPKKAARPTVDMPILECGVRPCDMNGDLSRCRGLHGLAATMPCWSCGRPMRECGNTCPKIVPVVEPETAPAPTPRKARKAKPVAAGGPSDELAARRTAKESA